MNALLTWPNILTAVGTMFIIIAGFLSSNESSKQQERIESLNREIEKSIMGGDSYAVAEPVIREKNHFNLLIYNKGKYPLYQLQVRVFDRDKFARLLSDFKGDEIQIKKNILAVHERAERIYQMGDLSPDQGTELGPFPLFPLTGEANFAISFLARNGAVSQELRLRRIDNQWVRAYKLERDGNVIEELHHSSYPKSQLP